MLAKGFSVPALQNPDLPQSISWLPLPVGWWWLLTVLLVCLLAFLLVRSARWYRNRWRREARVAIDHTTDVDSWLELIKRIHLVHQPRTLISQQIDPAMILHGVTLDSALHQQLCTRYCQQNNALSEADNQQMRQQMQRWLEALPDV